MVYLIDYTPLLVFLVENKKKVTELKIDLGISSSTVAKINKNEYLSLQIIESICLHYNIPIEQVVRITKD